jgi:hypothetical protein
VLEELSPAGPCYDQGGRESSRGAEEGQKDGGKLGGEERAEWLGRVTNLAQNPLRMTVGGQKTATMTRGPLSCYPELQGYRRKIPAVCHMCSPRTSIATVDMAYPPYSMCLGSRDLEGVVPTQGKQRLSIGGSQHTAFPQVA